MKLFSPDGSDLMAVEAIVTDGRDIQIKGKIMGAMPMTAVLRPAQLRQAFKLITPAIVWQALKMLLSAMRSKEI